MSRHERFAFATGDDFLRKAEELGVRLPFQESVAPLFRAISIGSKTIPNRLVVQTMEGFDANLDGSSRELTFRRYQRYAFGTENWKRTEIFSSLLSMGKHWTILSLT